MNAELIDQLGAKLGANGLPYTIPIHPNLVHLTLGLFIIGILFDIVGVFFPLHKFVYKYLALPVERANFFDVGWYNMLASAIITFFTVAAGFYEIMLAEAPVDVKSSWGMQAMETMLWHGVGGVLLLALIVGMTVWRGFQRFIWRKDEDRQVQLAELSRCRNGNHVCDVYPRYFGSANGCGIRHTQHRRSIAQSRSRPQRNYKRLVVSS